MVERKSPGYLNVNRKYTPLYTGKLGLVGHLNPTKYTLKKRDKYLFLGVIFNITARQLPCYYNGQL